jgi:hypothetical protein
MQSTAKNKNQGKEREMKSENENVKDKMNNSKAAANENKAIGRGVQRSGIGTDHWGGGGGGGGSGGFENSGEMDADQVGIRIWRAKNENQISHHHTKQNLHHKW